MAGVAAAAEAAERIAAVAVLDLGHAGAEVGEQHAGKRPGDHGGELDDPGAGERRHGQCPPATKPADAGRSYAMGFAPFSYITMRIVRACSPTRCATRPA